MKSLGKLYLKLAISCLVIASFSVGLRGQALPAGVTDVITASVQEAVALEKKALDLRKERAYPEAYTALGRAADIYVDAQRWEDAVRTLTNQFWYARRVENDDAPKSVATRSLGLLQEHLLYNQDLAGKVYLQRGQAYMIAKQVDSSNLFYQLSYEAYQKQENWVEACWSKISLAVNRVYARQETRGWQEIAVVEQMANERAMPDKERRYIKRRLVRLYVDMAGLNSDFGSAISRTQLALSRETTGAQNRPIDSSYVSYCNNKLGVLYHNLGNFARALNHFSQAGAYNTALLTNPNYNYNTGQLFLLKGEVVKARERFQACLDGVDFNDEASRSLRCKALVGISESFKVGDFYNEAIKYSQRAVAQGDVKDEYLALSSLATDQMGLGKIDEALNNLREAEAAYYEYPRAERNFWSFPSKLYRIFGDAFMLKGTPREALVYYQKALIENHESFKDSLSLRNNPQLSGIHDPTYFIEALSGKARALASLGENEADLNASLNTYELAMQWMDSLQTTYSSENAQLDWSETFKDIYEDAIHTAFLCHELNDNPEHLELAFVFSEKSKNAILLEELKMSEGRTKGVTSKSWLEREKNLELELANLSKTLRFSRASANTEDMQYYEVAVAGLRLELAALRDSLEREFPRYREIKYAKGSTGIERVQEDILDGHTAFLSYFLGKEKAYLYLITREDTRMIDLGDPQEIRSTTKAFISKLTNGAEGGNNAKKQFERYLGAGNQLYDLILKEALSSLPKDINRLLIVPDGLLNAVPFSAITNGTEVASSFDFAKLPYLLYRFDVQYAFSATLQIESQLRGEDLAMVTKGLIMAPQYTSTAGNTRGVAGVASLIGADKEQEAIAAFMEVDFETGLRATRDTFITIAKKYGLLHLSMHGGVDVADRGSSHLMFTSTSRAAAAGKENLLYHEDIINLDLFAQLVVLSACETGVGKYEDGEGVFSLGRSFTYAGVPSVVMSLWKVNDFTTSELMPLFYNQIAKGEAKDAALRQAKLKFLESADVDLRHPYYWSAFVSIGDSRPLRNGPFPWWHWALGGFAMLVLAGLADKRLRGSKALVKK